MQATAASAPAFSAMKAALAGLAPAFLAVMPALTVVLMAMTEATGIDAIAAAFALASSFFLALFLMV